MRHSTDDRYNLRFLVITVSDTRTESTDESGDRMLEYLHSSGRTATRCLVPNSEKIIAGVLEENSSNVEFNTQSDSIKVRCSVKAVYKTGVEMEAISCVQVSLLTIWDMVKYLEKDENGQYPETQIRYVKVDRKEKVALDASFDR